MRLVPELVGVTGAITVDWSVDDQMVATVDRPPYEADWNTAGLTPGNHALRLTVRDEQGGSQGATQPVRVAGPLRAAAATPTDTSEASGPLESLPFPPQVLLLGLVAIVAVGLWAGRRQSATPQVDQNTQTLLLSRAPTDPSGPASADATTILHPGGPADPTSADATTILQPESTAEPQRQPMRRLSSTSADRPVQLARPVYRDAVRDPAERPGDQTMTWMPGLTPLAGQRASLRIATPGAARPDLAADAGRDCHRARPGPGWDRRR